MNGPINLIQTMIDQHFVHQWEQPHGHQSNVIGGKCDICGDDPEHPIHKLNLYSIRVHDGQRDPDAGWCIMIVAAYNEAQASEIAQDSARERWDWDMYMCEPAEKLTIPTEPGLITEHY